MRHKEFELEEEISQLKSIISDQNLQLLPDYEQRIHVLHELNFIDENSRVQLKGRVACEVSTIITTSSIINIINVMIRFVS